MNGGGRIRFSILSFMASRWEGPVTGVVVGVCSDTEGRPLTWSVGRKVAMVGDGAVPSTAGGEEAGAAADDATGPGGLSRKEVVRL